MVSRRQLESYAAPKPNFLHNPNILDARPQHAMQLYAVVRQLGVGAQAEVLPVEPDEPGMALLKDINRQARTALRSLGISSPLL